MIVHYQIVNCWSQAMCLMGRADCKTHRMYYCSWQDESNGEIYNDRDTSVAAPIDPEALYVVENGKEYPLASVSKRRSLFVSQVRI